MDCGVSEPCYERIISILQKNYRKMTISWSFSYNSFVIFHVVKTFVSHNMTMLNPYLCFKGTVLYCRFGRGGMV